MHYRRAFELMPNSFGRVESHCFGCEGIFRSEIAQATAEAVFMRIVKERPDKPQIHYLLGELRNSQNKYDEALASYQKAVELDPDYLNAWKSLHSMDEHIALQVKQRRDALHHIMRLSNDYYYIRNNKDLKLAWEASMKDREERNRALAPLYPLRASQRALEEHIERMAKAGYPKLTVKAYLSPSFPGYDYDGFLFNTNHPLIKKLFDQLQ